MGEHRRLARLPLARVEDRPVRVAADRRARLLGLAGLSREQAGEGLLIPRCSSVHTFGMRFPIDVTFLDREGRAIARRRFVPPRRVLRQSGARAVLETPSPAGSSRS